MRINLLILKNDGSIERKRLEKLVQTVIKGFLEGASENCKINDVRFEVKLVSDNCADLELLTEANRTIDATKEFDNLTWRLIESLDKQNLNTIVAYDEVSDFLCNSLMPYFTKYERKLRRLIYTTVIGALGSQWFDITFTKEHKEYLKTKKKVKMDKPNNALEELDYGHIYQYLFELRRFRDYDLLLEDELSSDKIDRLEKDEIIYYIDSTRKVSLWQRFFGEYSDVKELPNLINGLNNPRNIVMHSKRISFDQYNKTKLRLKTINGMLDKAIKYAESKMYSEIDKVEVSMSLYDVYESMAQASSKLLESIIPKTDMLKGLGSIYASSFADIDFKNPFKMDFDYKDLPVFKVLDDKTSKYNSIMDSLSETIKQSMPQLNSIIRNSIDK